MTEPQDPTSNWPPSVSASPSGQWPSGQPAAGIGQPPVGAPSSDSSQWAQGAPAPYLDPQGDHQKTRRNNLGLALGGLGVVVLLIVAFTVVRGINGQTAGASSPDDLVSQLTQVTTKVDPAGAIALLDPKEVPGLGALYQTAVDQARKGADVDVPGALQAISITTQDVTHTVTYLDAEQRFAKVSFTGGSITYDAQPAKLPEGVKKRFTDDDGQLPEAEHETTNFNDLRIETPDGKKVDPFLVLVKEDGRWYISITMTAGEYAVESMGLDPGRFDAAIEPGPPARSPQEAVEKLFTAVQDQVNTGKTSGGPLNGLFPEAQTRAIRIYSHSLRSGIDQMFGTMSTDSESMGDPMSPDDDINSDFTFKGLEAECDGCGVSYSNLNVRTEKRGDFQLAILSSLSITAKQQSCYEIAYSDGSSSGSYGSDSDMGTGEWLNYDPGMDDSSGSNGDDVEGGNEPGDYGSTPESDCSIEKDEAKWDGKCLTWSSTYDPKASLPDDETDSACLTDKLGDSDLSLTDFGVTDVHFVVSAERGGWVIDPVATIMDYGRVALSHLTDPNVKAALNDD